MRSHIHWRAIPLVVMALPVITGCGSGGGKKSKIEVVHYPEFYRPEYKRVAVIPFADLTGNPAVAEHMTNKVETALVQNRTYEVYTRQNLKAVLDEQDLAAAGIIDSDVAKRIGELASVQLLVCGQSTRYIVGQETVMVPQYVPTEEGGYYIQVPVQQHHAIVECGVKVIDTATGQVLAATDSPANFVWRADTRYPYPGLTVPQVAEELCARYILSNIAVTQSRIKLKGKVLEIATGQYDGKWDKVSKLTPDVQEIFIVVRLPADAARNDFRVAFVAKDQRKDLISHEFIWPDGVQEQSFPFPTKPLLDNGLGEYTVKLYSGPAPVAWKNFKIVEPKENDGAKKKHSD